MGSVNIWVVLHSAYFLTQVNGKFDPYLGQDKINGDVLVVDVLGFAVRFDLLQKWNPVKSSVHTRETQ